MSPYEHEIYVLMTEYDYSREEAEKEVDSRYDEENDYYEW